MHDTAPNPDELSSDYQRTLDSLREVFNTNAERAVDFGDGLLVLATMLPADSSIGGREGDHRLRLVVTLKGRPDAPQDDVYRYSVHHIGADGTERLKPNRGEFIADYRPVDIMQHSLNSGGYLRSLLTAANGVGFDPLEAAMVTPLGAPTDAERRAVASERAIERRHWWASRWKGFLKWFTLSEPEDPQSPTDTAA